MTCAETRRQLPEPEPTLATEVEAHLSSCAPCRGECESLKEVERRLERLAAARRDAAAAAWRRQLSRMVADEDNAPGLPKPAKRAGAATESAAVPSSASRLRLLVLSACLCGLLGIFLLGLLWRLRH